MQEVRTTVPPGTEDARHAVCRRDSRQDAHLACLQASMCAFRADVAHVARPRRPWPREPTSFERKINRSSGFNRNDFLIHVPRSSGRFDRETESFLSFPFKGDRTRLVPFRNRGKRNQAPVRSDNVRVRVWWTAQRENRGKLELGTCDVASIARRWRRCAHGAAHLRPEERRGRSERFLGSVRGRRGAASALQPGRCAPLQLASTSLDRSRCCRRSARWLR